MKIREAEIIELVRCDSIVSAWASTPTVGDGVHINQNTLPVYSHVGLYLKCLSMN